MQMEMVVKKGHGRKGEIGKKFKVESGQYGSKYE